MKKINYLNLYLIILFISCTNKNNTPEKITLSFFNTLYNERDIDKAETYCTEESKEKLRRDFKFIDGALQMLDENKGNEKYNYKIVKEKSVIKKDSAFITVASSLDSTEIKTLLIKINNEWKIDFNYE